VLAVPSWRAEAGDAWLLAGVSGSGKSTLLNILAGLITPSAGRVVVAGQDLAALPGGACDRWRGRHVGLVPQKLHLVGAVNVADNLRLACTMAGLPVDEARIRALLESVHVADLARRLPRELSQGQAQRVAIARAVVNRPALMLADEPTANLDDLHAAAALELLRTQALEAGATLVVASHDARVRPLLPRSYELPACEAEAV
jgi:putative ABC transport system ATP-binding protein